MIGYLRGVLKEVHDDRCVIDVNGVGYDVYCSKLTLGDLSAALSRNPGEVLLHTRLIHREDTLDLYGFLYKEEQHLFNLLITVSGVGPKQAIKILGTTKVPDIVHAVVYEDSAFLMKLSGIGKKRSQQIILELKEKLQQSFEFPAAQGGSGFIEAISALQALGFTRGEAREAVENALQMDPEEQDVGKIVERALKNLS
jgi:Holliday junction DNA helicase RuvA subunit